jgi:hypothetical protein
MPPRTDFQDLLEAILGSGEVYFQPPSSVQIRYPCIVYKLNNIDTGYADNKPYSHEKQYMVTVIDKNPDSIIPDEIGMLPKSVFNRHFTSDNLHHYVYTVYF